MGIFDKCLLGVLAVFFFSLFVCRNVVESSSPWLDWREDEGSIHEKLFSGSGSFDSLFNVCNISYKHKFLTTSGLFSCFFSSGASSNSSSGAEGINEIRLRGVTALSVEEQSELTGECMGIFDKCLLGVLAVFFFSLFVCRNVVESSSPWLDWREDEGSIHEKLFSGSGSFDSLFNVCNISYKHKFSTTSGLFSCFFSSGESSISSVGESTFSSER